MKLQDRKDAITNKPGYVEGSLSDTVEDGGVHKLEFQINGERKVFINGEMTTESITRTIVEKWRVYNEGTDEETIKAIL